MTSKYQVQEKGRISALQLAFLNITVIIATADVFLPSFVAQEAKQDSWISVILGTVTGLIAVNIMLALGLRYPEKTLIQYTCDILGKPLGKLVVLLYIFYFFLVAYAVTGELGEVFKISFSPTSPIAKFSILTILTAAYAVKKGLEVIARVNDILLPIGIFVLVLIFTINIPRMRLDNFLPILYNGIYPSIKGSILIQSWFFETILMLQLIPFVKDKKKIRKYINLSILFLSSSLMLGVGTVAVLGVLTEKFMFPTLQFVKLASIGHYVQNLDISIMMVWVAGIFIKITITYYAAALATAQFLGFASYKGLVIPLGLLIIIFSLTATRMVTDVIHFLHYILPLYFFIMAFVMPALLLTISAVESRLKGSSAKTKQA